MSSGGLNSWAMGLQLRCSCSSDVGVTKTLNQQRMLDTGLAGQLNQINLRTAHVAMGPWSWTAGEPVNMPARWYEQTLTRAQSSHMLGAVTIVALASRCSAPQSVALPHIQHAIVPWEGRCTFHQQ
jgi:hypothetical protein